MSSSLRRHRSIGFALGGLAAFVAALATLKTEVLRNIEFVSYDLRVSAASPHPVEPRIVHLNIDDASVRADALGRWPWPRDAHARTVDLLTELGAEAIVFDVEFIEPQAPYIDPERRDELVHSAEFVRDAMIPEVRDRVLKARECLDKGDPDGADLQLMQLRENLPVFGDRIRVFFDRLLIEPDREFADSIVRSGRVVLPVRFRSETASNPESPRIRDSSWPVGEPDLYPIGQTIMEPPFPAFAQGAGSFGVVNLRTQDPDRISRRAPTLYRYAGRVYVQLGLKVALDHSGEHWSIEERERAVVFRNEKGESFEIPVDSIGATILDWRRGRWEELYPQHSYASVWKPAQLAHEIEALLARLEALVRTLEIEGVPAWPPRGPDQYLKTGTWATQAAFLNAIEPVLEKAALDGWRDQVRVEAVSLVREMRPLLVARDAGFAKIRDSFRGKIVFIGSTESASTDLKVTSTHSALPGVFFHSTLADMVLQRRFIRPANDRTVLLIILVASLAATVIASFGRPVVTGPLTVGLVAGYVGFTFWTFDGHRIVLPVVGPALCSIVSYIVVLAFRFVTEDREKRLIRTIFQHYLSPKLVDRLIEDPKRAALGGERREITVLFTDVHGFTSFVENNPSDLVVRTLNEYLQTITEIILDRNGYLDKYLGDGILALFGVFDGTPEDAAEQACRTALDAHRALEEFRARQKDLNHPLQETRFGIASGTAVVGNVGTSDKVNYTAIGDAVNVAARLQVLNKKTRTRILLDERTYELAGGRIRASLLGPHEVEGRAKAVVVYELTEVTAARLESRGDRT